MFAPDGLTALKKLAADYGAACRGGEFAAKELEKSIDRYAELKANPDASKEDYARVLGEIQRAMNMLHASLEKHDRCALTAARLKR